MVTYRQLFDAKPALWEAAADDALAVAKQATRTADNIHFNGAKPLADNWPDQTGAQARSALVRCADRMVDTGILARGGAVALDTLEDAVRTAQDSLKAAVSFALSRGLTVGEDGSVTVPDDMPDDEIDQAKRAADQARELIRDAVEAATQADQSCVDALNACTVDPDSISTPDAQKRQAKAVEAALKSIRNLLPDGQSPENVARWWAGLTDEQRKMFERAVPVELHDLPGIPGDVKHRLEDTGRGYNPVETVRWAKQNAHNEKIDVFSVNCANFASNALHAGGLKYKLDAWRGTSDSRNWGRRYEDQIPQPGATHTRSWFNSDAQREFFLHNDGTEVPIGEARPGDVVYFNYSHPTGDDVSHHTAVVTAVLPDGQVLYTQHTPGAVDQSLQDRLPMISQGEGQQTPVIVRPKESW
ncbi:amidase domain-containing protein [Gordonia sp. X0973]|uniref:amidase domain-containing protein n=1 Tax=Gordonia sp. X0973 TaxID=2742602 RepID=UPI000F5373CD|nr:amidase domain-containing protein [Gordonia sp. X0973]QKT07057.1 amidase domain-containing protein [Gordonia sp. X0973]